jgi:hypothetical protein
MSEYILCLGILVDILGLLSLGPDLAVRHMRTLQQLLRLHGDMFGMLYPGAAKPKFHAQFHIVDNVQWLGKLLSCFVTERKHRVSKASALHVFRNMEHTVIADVVNRLCEQMTDSATMFVETYLVKPWSFVSDGTSYSYAQSANLACGEIRNGDIIWLRTRNVCRVKDFWQHSPSAEDMHVRAEVLQKVNANNAHEYSETSDEVVFFEVDSIIDACIWHRVGPDRIHVLMPYAAKC